MLQLVALFIGAAVINSYLSCSYTTGTGFQSSPMGKIGSRMIYSHSQIPWHNGVDAEFVKTFHEYRVGALPGYFDAVYMATKPDLRFAHPNLSSMETLSKNLLTVKLMRISLNWDPANYNTAYDLAFLLQGPLQKPELSLRVLDETLRLPLKEEGRLMLQIQKFLLLYNRFEKKEQALALLPEIQFLAINCERLPPTRDLDGLLRCAHDLQQLQKRPAQTPLPIKGKKTETKPTTRHEKQ